MEWTFGYLAAILGFLVLVFVLASCCLRYYCSSGDHSLCEDLKSLFSSRSQKLRNPVIIITPPEDSFVISRLKVAQTTVRTTHYWSRLPNKRPENIQNKANSMTPNWQSGISDWHLNTGGSISNWQYALSIKDEKARPGSSVTSPNWQSEVTANWHLGDPPDQSGASDWQSRVSNWQTEVPRWQLANQRRSSHDSGACRPTRQHCQHPMGPTIGQSIDQSIRQSSAPTWQSRISNWKTEFSNRATSDITINNGPYGLRNNQSNSNGSGTSDQSTSTGNNPNVSDNNNPNGNFLTVPRMELFLQDRCFSSEEDSIRSETQALLRNGRKSLKDRGMKDRNRKSKNTPITIKVRPAKNDDEDDGSPRPIISIVTSQSNHDDTSIQPETESSLFTQSRNKTHSLKRPSNGHGNDKPSVVNRAINDENDNDNTKTNDNRKGLTNDNRNDFKQNNLNSYAKPNSPDKYINTKRRRSFDFINPKFNMEDNEMILPGALTANGYETE